MTAPPATVLVIDDEEQIRRQLVKFIEEFDEFIVAVADSAEEALSILGNIKTDICIVDMRLPGLTGMEFIEEAKAKGLCNHFIMHTGSVDLLLDQEWERVGLTKEDIFIKPSDMASMVSRMHQVLWAC